jgi:hypothetical protein
LAKVKKMQIKKVVIPVEPKLDKVDDTIDEVDDTTEDMFIIDIGGDDPILAMLNK